MIPVGCDDDHGFRRSIGERQVKGNGLILMEAIHPAVQVTPDAVVVKGYFIIPAGYAQIALRAGRGQGTLREEGEVHPGGCDLGIRGEIQQGDAVHGHISVVVDRQRQRKAVTADAVVIPFLDPQRVCGHPPAVVGFDQFRRVAGLGEAAFFVMKGSGNNNAALHETSLLFFSSL